MGGGGCDQDAPNSNFTTKTMTLVTVVYHRSKRHFSRRFCCIPQFKGLADGLCHSQDFMKKWRKENDNRNEGMWDYKALFGAEGSGKRGRGGGVGGRISSLFLFFHLFFVANIYVIQRYQIPLPSFRRCRHCSMCLT